MPMKSPFRTLFVIYAAAMMAGICEYIVNPSSRVPDSYESPVHNFSTAVSRLYPRTAQAEYLLGRQFEVQAGQGFNRDEMQRNPAALTQFMSSLNADLTKAARHYKRAIAMGLKSEETLYYNYALTLIRLRDDPTRIDRAIADWRRNFPYSNLRDLEEQRKLLEEQARQLPPGTTPPADREEIH